jgi:hypothetical protein
MIHLRVLSRSLILRAVARNGWDARRQHGTTVTPGEIARRGTKRRIDYEWQDCQTERGTIRTPIAALCAAIRLAHMRVGVPYASCSLQTGAVTDAGSAHCRGYLLSNVLRVLALSLPGRVSRFQDVVSTGMISISSSTRPSVNGGRVVRPLSARSLRMSALTGPVRWVWPQRAGKSRIVSRHGRSRSTAISARQSPPSATAAARAALSPASRAGAQRQGIATLATTCC